MASAERVMDQVCELPRRQSLFAWPQMSNSILVGKVAHVRKTPADHRFVYGLYMVCLNVDHLPRRLRRGRWWPFSFQPADHMKGTQGNLATAVRDTVEAETGLRPGGDIYLLTQLRCWGFYFSPLNLYFCYDDQHSEQLLAIVAEVNNTPWGEQHRYVLHRGNMPDCGVRHGDDRGARPATASQSGRFSLRFSHDKSFHVSPFMDMDSRYEWRFSASEQGISILLACHKAAGRVFHASMMLKKRPFSHWRLWLTSLRFPWMTLQIVAAIYWQALKLWWKKCPFYSHPNKQPANSPSGPATP